jgi:hypothetical protein
MGFATILSGRIGRGRVFDYCSDDVFASPEILAAFIELRSTAAADEEHFR